MAYFSYISPILPGKTNSLLSHFQQSMKLKQEDPIEEEIGDDFFKLVGLKSWRFWISSFEGKDYFIHCLEGDSLTDILLRLQYFITLKVPFAVKLHKIYLSYLGKDYLINSNLPEIKTKYTFTPKTSSAKSDDVKSFILPLKLSKLPLFDETIIQLKDQISFSQNTQEINISFQKVSKNNFFIIVQAEGKKDISWSDINLNLSRADLESIFDIKSIPFPKSLDDFEKSSKALSSIA